MEVKCEYWAEVLCFEERGLSGATNGWVLIFQRNMVRELEWDEKKKEQSTLSCWSSSRNSLPINPSSQFTPPCQERHQSPLGAALLGGNTKQSVNDLSAHMQVDRARDHLGYRPTSSISDTNTTLPTCSTHSKCVCHQSSGLKQQTQGLCGEGTTRYSGFGGFLSRCVGWVVSDLPVITEKKNTMHTCKTQHLQQFTHRQKDMMKTCRNKHVRSTHTVTNNQLMDIDRRTS